MRGMLDGVWYELEEVPEATLWLGVPHYQVRNDPERGSWDQDDFEEFEP